MGFIYKITSPTGRLYVGQTKHIGRRISCYRHKLVNSYGWKNAMIMNSLKKYGWASHKFEIIEECDDSNLNNREIFWIKELNTYCFDNSRNMNMSRGGEDGAKPWMHDVERRAVQSKRFSGEGNPFYGKTHSMETKGRLAKIMRERNKAQNINIPEWGAEKGRCIVRKPVLCYNSSGEFFKEFDCAATASREMGLEHTSIAMVCSKKRTNVGGYVFRYKNGEIPLQIEVGELKQQAVKKPVLLIAGKKIFEFESPEAASKATNTPKTTIRRACAYNNMHPLRNGMVFIYKDLYDKIYKNKS